MSETQKQNHQKRPSLRTGRFSPEVKLIFLIKYKKKKKTKLMSIYFHIYF